MTDYITVWDEQAGRWVQVPVTPGRDESRPAPPPRPEPPQPQGKLIYDDLGRPAYSGGEW